MYKQINLQMSCDHNRCSRMLLQMIEQSKCEPYQPLDVFSFDKCFHSSSSKMKSDVFIETKEF